MERHEDYSVEAFVKKLEYYYPVYEFQERLLTKLRNHTAFEGSTRKTIKHNALKALDTIGDTVFGPKALAMALHNVSNELWKATEVNPIRATKVELKGAIEKFVRRMNADPDLALRFGPSSASTKHASKPRKPARERDLESKVSILEAKVTELTTQLTGI
ncbi:hypothetical protein GGI06_006715 [Coemansia sp. S85]|nr:hypothetical protein GGI06_006715 [Coemansia sp. S85]